MINRLGRMLAAGLLAVALSLPALGAAQQEQTFEGVGYIAKLDLATLQITIDGKSYILEQQAVNQVKDSFGRPATLKVGEQVVFSGTVDSGLLTIDSIVVGASK